jgi:prepilin-type N-terminal cleavage/methylation domain-containing protein
MKPKKEEGFSLIELLMVCVIGGVLAAIAVPSLTKGARAAENGAALAALRVIASTEARFYTSHSRFGTLDEINADLGGNLGQTIGVNQVVKSHFLYEMVPATPTNAELKDTYTITTSRYVAGETVIYKFSVDQTGFISQILP